MVEHEPRIVKSARREGYSNGIQNEGMQAYSQDLRQRILHTVDQGKPRAEIVKTFEVSRATIKRYLKLRRETGEVRAKAIPDGSIFMNDALGRQTATTLW
jgi:hypothetical protein